jgi:exodeoxyribonuclease VII small subunit
MAKNSPKPIEGLTYERAIAELETIVAALESGERPLEETMHLFERSQALIKHCVDLLDKAELKVQTLTGDTLGDFKEEQ